LALGFAWFAWRRYHEAAVEVKKRLEAEAQLFQTLAENQRLGQQYVLVQESERKALARELHDELGQYLNAIKVDAVAIRDQAMREFPSLYPPARSLIGSVDHVYGVVRDLIGRLRPVGIDDLGLAAALEHCVEHWRGRLASTEFKLVLEGDVEGLSDQMRLTIYRVVQECLTNVSRHALASQVEIRFRRLPAKPDRMELTVVDDGQGAENRPSAGFGLLGMRERVEVLGGSFAAQNRADGGFCVRVRFPREAEHPEVNEDDDYDPAR
jgi:glucose-6-phosphate-specific signal transduction histidine kinase